MTLIGEPIHFECDHCGQSIEVPPSMAREAISCPSCKGPLMVPPCPAPVGIIPRPENSSSSTIPDPETIWNSFSQLMFLGAAISLVIGIGILLSVNDPEKERWG